MNQLSERDTTTSSVQPRAIISRLPKYSSGKPAQAVEGLTAYKLSSNENPMGPVPEVADVLKNFHQVHRYPDSTASALREKLASYLNVDVEDIVTGAGSLGALTQILTTFAGANDNAEPDEVIYSWRSFEAYPICVALTGAKSVQIPNLPDGSHDLDSMAQAINERTRVILICTPNNPTGPAVSEAQLRNFLNKVPSHVVVVIDEAYFEFCVASDDGNSEHSAVNGLDIYPDFENVIVLRTFSKAQGLANLRVGYSISHPQLTQYLRVAATPFAVNGIAQEAAIASIEHHDQVMERVRHLVSERERIVSALEELGWWIPQTRANFIWLALGEHSAEFTELAEKNALSVRAFGDEGVRVSVGEDEANDRFITLCAKFEYKPTPPKGSEN